MRLLREAAATPCPGAFCSKRITSRPVAAAGFWTDNRLALEEPHSEELYVFLPCLRGKDACLEGRSDADTYQPSICQEHYEVRPWVVVG